MEMKVMRCVYDDRVCFDSSQMREEYLSVA